MKQLSPFSIKLPLDVRHWIEKQAGQRKMTMTDYVLQLLIKGIQAESIDATVARITDACDAANMKEVLRQTLITRYIVETHARSAIRMPERLGTDALTWADKELTRIMPGAGK